MTDGPPPAAPVLDPHVEELLRGLHHRLDGLDEEFNDLIGRRGEGARSAAVAALRELSSYTRDIERMVSADVARPRRRPGPLAAKLRAHSETVVHATRRLQEWFAAPYSDDVPVALLQAVETTCRSLQLVQRRAVITVGPPTRIETTVPDVRSALYHPEHAPAPPREGPQFALVTIPRHEGRSPRWWPVVLGHEISHLRIRDLSRGTQAAGQQDSELPPDIVGSPSHYYFMLQRLGILTGFPFERMREVIKQEADAQLDSLSTTPPGLTPRRKDLDSDGEEPLGTASTTLARRVQVANRWATEIVCDLVMARRFGPAAVAALGSYLTAIGDYSVLSLTHPPGRLRLALLNQYLAGTDGAVLRSILDPWVYVSDATEDDPADEWSQLLGDYLSASFAQLKGEVDEHWPGERYRTEDPRTERAVVLAARQLSFGVPPFDARPEDFDRGHAERPSAPDADGTAVAGSATDVDICVGAGTAVRLTDADLINAGWAVVMAARRGVPGIPSRDAPFDRLVLKALEDQQLLADIRERTPVGAQDASVADALATAGPLADGAVLGRAAIEARLQEPEPGRRLVVTPMLAESLQRASVDVRLGNRFIIFQRTSTTSFNALRGHNPREVQRLVERGWGSPFVLHPGEVVLASVLEYIALPYDLSAQVITRSSYGRLGLITATAVQVHPLYRGCLTLELVNLGTVPLELYPGERIAQLVFLAVQQPEGHTPPPVDLTVDRYSCPTGPQFPAVTVDPWVKRTVPDE